MKQGSIRVSAIVCTYNGASRLKCVANSLLEQEYDSSRFEVLIIDNHSSDNTREICEKIIRSSPGKRIEYYLEKNRGLSHARNRGIKESKGQILAFIDDDAVADSHWLLNIDNALSDKSIHAVGGKVLPIFDKPRPPWLSSGIDSMLTILDLGDQTGVFEYPFNGPCGTNMAFRKSVLDKVGYFDPDLGRHGNKLLCGEETDLLMRMQTTGMNFVYTPHCIVHHHVPESRLTKTCVRKRAFHQGYSIALLALKRGSFVNTVAKDIKSIFFKRKSVSDSARLRHQTTQKGCFYYEVKVILFSSYLFFLLVNAPRKSLP